jgi:4-amino-4-deoxy-L-arabinose transferase-like glycosyltransferase
MFYNAELMRRLKRTIESVLVFVFVTALLALSSRGIGLTFDEPLYFEFSDSVRGWFASGHPFDDPSLQHFWAYDPYHNPHPPFMKILCALTAGALEDRIVFPLDYRLGSHLYLGACAALLYSLLRTAYSRWMSALAILFVALPPRVFGDMMIGTSDAPVAIAALLLPVLLWKVLTCDKAGARGALWVLFFLVHGFAVATKFPGLLTIIPCGAYCVYRRRPRECVFLVAAVVYALGFLVVVSPEKWHAPAHGILEYLYYPFTRSAIPIASIFLGRKYAFYLPWSYFDFMSLVTYPVVLWLLLPGVLYARKTDKELLGPVLFALGFWVVLGHLPSTPKHDGVRQFLSVYPLISLVVWVGLQGLLAQWKVEIARWERLAHVVLPATVVGLLAAVVWRAHPHELSYYNALIGGIRGAERNGMEMSYFFEPVGPPFIEAMNREIHDGATVQILPDWPLLLVGYRIKGVLIPSITILPEDSKEVPDYRIVLRRRATIDDEWYRAQPAIYETEYDGVSLAKLIKVRG